jgi:hypothetical protein
MGSELAGFCVSDTFRKLVAILDVQISRLRNTAREDVVFIAFQLWVLGMSVVAVRIETREQKQTLTHCFMLAFERVYSTCDCLTPHAYARNRLVGPVPLIYQLYYYLNF